MSLIFNILNQASGGDEEFNTSSRVSMFDGGRKSLSGEVVTATTSNKLASYYACVRNISEDIGKLPLKIYTNLKGGGRLPDTKNPLYKLFALTPNPEMTAIVFKQTMQAHCLNWGNCYGEIQRNQRGTPIAIWPIHPSRVCVVRNDNKEIEYHVYQNSDFIRYVGRKVGTFVIIPAEDMFHVQGLGSDGLVGQSIVGFAKESLGNALATQDYAGSLYGNGAQLGGFFEYPGNISKEAQENFLNTFYEEHAGSKNAGKSMILEEGMKWNNTQMAPKDAQFIQLRNFQTEEIARWFRMPPHKIQKLDKAGFNSLEAQNQDYVTDTLTPWAVRWEQEVGVKLLDDERNAFAKYSFNSLLRGDTAARSAFYKALFAMGAFTPNEIRLLEDRNPLPGGDVSFLPLNLQTLEAAANATNEDANKAQGQANTSGPKGTAGENETKSQEVDDKFSCIMPVVVSTVSMVNRKERKAIQNAFIKHTDKEAITTWSEGFYTAQTTYALNSLEPALLAFVAMNGLTHSDYGVIRATLATDLTSWYNGRAFACVRGVTDLDDQKLINIFKLSLKSRATNESE